MKQEIVVKHNSFVNARYNLSLLEQRLLMVMISQINSHDKDFMEYHIPVKEIINKVSQEHDSFTEIYKAAVALRRREIMINNNEKFIIVGLVSSIEHTKKNGYLSVTFDPKMKPFLLQLKNNFTKYKLGCVLKLKSIYSIRIYEILKQYERLKERMIPLDELKLMLCVDNRYKNYFDFKRFVLNISQREINQKTDIKVNYKEIKKGKKITDIVFHIESQNVEEITESVLPKLLEKNEINTMKEKLLEFIENKKVEEIIKKFDSDYIQHNFEYARKNYDINKGAFGCFLLSAIEGDYAKYFIKKQKEENNALKKKAAIF